MVDKYDYLLNQGWSKEDAEKYIELQERGLSPQEAFESVRGGAKSEDAIPVQHIYEPQTEKAKFQPQSFKEKLFGRPITASEVETKVGQGIEKFKTIAKEEYKGLKSDVKKVVLKPVKVPRSKTEKQLAREYLREQARQRRYLERLQRRAAARQVIQPRFVPRRRDPMMEMIRDRGFIYGVSFMNAPSSIDTGSHLVRFPSMRGKKHPVNDNSAVIALGLEGFV